MEQKHHYSGLTDAQVLESRAKYGVNILTPPEEGTVWDKIKDSIYDRHDGSLFQSELRGPLVCI